MTVFYTVSGIPAAQTRASSSQMRAEFVLVQTGFASVNTDITANLASVTASIATKGAITGQTWTGAHDFSGASSFKVPTPVSATDAVTKSYADNLAISAVVPAQPGGASTYHLSSTLGVASWVLDTAYSTAAQIKTGSIGTTIVAPSALLAALGFSAYVQTADQTITSAGALTIAHGLGRTPVLLQAFLKNVTTQGNYVAGDIVPTPIGSHYDGAAYHGVTVTADATNLYVRFSSAAAAFNAFDKTAGTSFSCGNANWSFFLRAFA